MENRDVECQVHMLSFSCRGWQTIVGKQRKTWFLPSGLKSVLTPFAPPSSWEKKKRETCVGLEELQHLFMHKLFPPLYIDQLLMTSPLNFLSSARSLVHSLSIHRLSLIWPHTLYGHTPHTHYTILQMSHNTCMTHGKEIANMFVMKHLKFTRAD